MTEIEQQDVLTRYKNGQSLKQIYLETGISGNTVASFIRRKHPNLQKWNQYKKVMSLTQQTNKLQKELGCSKEHAQAIVCTMQERFVNKRNAARLAKREFTITFDQLSFPTNCPYLGIPLDYLEENPRASSYPTFDRIDNTKDYIPGNVLIVSWRGNRLKSDSDYTELKKLAENLEKLHMQSS